MKKSVSCWNREKKIIACSLLFFASAYAGEDKELLSKSFKVGVATGATTSLILEPIIYMKNSWQQKLPLSKNLLVYYRGLLVNAAGFIPTMAIQNSAFNQTENYLRESQLSPLSKNLIGALAAGTASALPCSPRELLIIQQQKKGKNVYQTTRDIVKMRGWHKLLRGITPVAIRNCSFASFFFIGAPRIEQELNEQFANHTVNAIYAGMIAGCLSALATHPLDTTKTIMQGNLLSKKSMLATMKTIYKNEGFKRFFFGLTPRTTGVAIGMALEYNLRKIYTDLLS